MLSKSGIIKLLRPETGIGGVTKFKMPLFGGKIPEDECK